MSDLNILLKDTSKVHNTSFTGNDFDYDPKDYITKAVLKYAGNTFLVSGGPEQEPREIFVSKNDDVSIDESVDGIIE